MANPCAHCGSQMQDGSGRGGHQPNRKYCSIKCKQYARNEASKASALYRCDQCGTTRALLRPPATTMCRPCAATLGSTAAASKLLALPVKDRIAESITINEDGCWEWRGHTQANGYGSMSVNGRPQRTHRIAYEEYVGPIPAGLEIDHLCRNRSCCNPKHLEPVTRAENMRRANSYRGHGEQVRHGA